jgi:hypothetical protein
MLDKYYVHLLVIPVAASAADSDKSIDVDTVGRV